MQASEEYMPFMNIMKEKIAMSKVQISVHFSRLQVVLLSDSWSKRVRSASEREAGASVKRAICLVGNFPLIYFCLVHYFADCD